MVSFLKSLAIPVVVSAGVTLAYHKGALNWIPLYAGPKS